ncbi:thioredoxin family protein [Algoriphagus sp. AGSA1]|uniref:TlpA family protein disulfide reductase n=1 Tax=Algoriphagus sp. AGSA1 TaxID=2907213 RepID=UPI001F3522A2|nr:thioredoxin family protein [Algoriphagus sp. AGSA1]MCE7057157.1 thioredoxin family protein [Algoriphagus sp. AGSA1]
MKKHLFTCFLASLFLYGSELKAQVDVSPIGADFLHRSVPQVSPEQGDLHRGGETRPDTLPEDGSLVDYSGIHGQEGESPSAFDTLGSAVVWGMVSEYSDRDVVFLEVYQDYYFNSANAPESSFVTMPLAPGKLMEGAYPKDKIFQYNLLDMEGNHWLSLKLKGSGYILDRMLIQPGDSVQVYIDLEKTQVMFAGPQADKFKFQYGLQLLEREYYLDRDRVMVTDGVEKIMNDPVHGKDYREVMLGAGPKMTFITRGAEELTRIRSFDPYAKGGVLAVKAAFIETWEDRLDGDYLAFFKREGQLDEWRKHLGKINNALKFAEIRGDSSMIASLTTLGKERLQLAEQEVENWLFAFSAELMEYTDLKTRLASRLSGKPDLDIIQSITPDWLREKALVRKFYKAYESIENVDASLLDALGTVNGGDAHDLLTALAKLKSTGSPVSGFEFLSRQGDPVSLEELDAELFFVEFWITGCKACVAFKENTLTQIQEKFGEDPRLKVITVSADFTREVWEKSLQSNKYTLPGFTNLYTGEGNRKHPFLREYGIRTFPNRIILDGEGRILMVSNVPFSGDELIPLIQGYLEKSSLSVSESELHNKQTIE